MNCADLRPRLLAMLLLIGALLTPAHAAVPTGGGTCHGRFANPITDICWNCLFPLTIGGIGIVSDGQPDMTLAIELVHSPQYEALRSSLNDAVRHLAHTVALRTQQDVTAAGIVALICLAGFAFLALTDRR